jgi:transcriptional regulator with XRE-family HTH domain
MGATAQRAFGAYLKSLRQRRALSLRRVCELSADSSTPLDKATLSRCEHGSRKPTVTALLTLSRIYDVPTEVLLERYELDVELDQAGPPQTEGLTYAALSRAGREALGRGLKWRAYGYLREATSRAPLDPPAPGMRAEEQCHAAWVNLTTVARSLGKVRYALFEYSEILPQHGLLPQAFGIVLDRLANCYRSIGQFGLAERFADEALYVAASSGEDGVSGFASFSKASNAIDRGDVREGIEHLRRVWRLHRELTGPRDVQPSASALPVATLLKLSEGYWLTGMDQKAGQIAMVARAAARRSNLPREQAGSGLLLGLIQARRGETERALEWWRDTARMARGLRNHRVGFLAEFYAYREMLHLGRRASADASRRRLERLATKAPTYMPELQEFRALVADRNANGGLVDSASCSPVLAVE